MLPSQTARPSESRAHMYRRGKSRPWLALVGGAIVVALGIFAVKWMVGPGQPASAEAGESQLQANAESASGDQKSAAPSTGKTPTSSGGSSTNNPATPPANQPVKIAMGEPVPGANAGQAKTAAPPAVVKSPSASNQNSGAPAGAQQPQQPQPQPSRSDLAGGGGAPARDAAPKPPVATPDNSSAPASQRVQLGLDLIKQNKPIEARKMLSEVLASPGVSNAEADRIRAELTRLNERLVFGPDITAGDPFVSMHQIAAGEALAKLPRKLGLSVDWRFLQRINQINDPARIRAGQKIKVIKGPFHAIIDKRTFRLDLYMGEFSDRVYVRSFTVGLGEYGATPEGAFVVKPDSKLVNPAWTNPRTGEHFQPDDPKNPLGEYWIGLVGASDNIRGLESYGIHGTIDPTSIGKEMSMGCVRLAAEDIKLIYEVLMENVSRVEIQGNDWP